MADLIGGRREFIDAYEILLKELNEDVLVRLYGEVRAMKVPMTKEDPSFADSANADGKVRPTRFQSASGIQVTVALPDGRREIEG